MHQGICSALKIDELEKLEVSDDTRAHYMEAMRWTRDLSKFPDAVNDVHFERHRTRLTADDIDKLNKFGKFVFVPARCGVKSFPVAEWFKSRRRPIFWPDINAYIPKDMLQESRLPLKNSVRTQVKKGHYSKQFDFKGWFDQIPLSINVSPLFGLDANKCLAQLPMGFRPAVEVAQAITLMLVDFPYPEGVECIAYIDNVRFTGPSKKAVEQAAETFRERCKAVNAIIGSETQTSQLDDFLGERYDYQESTRRLTDKNLEKLWFVRNMLLNDHPLVYRQLSAIYGLLFYSSSVLDVKLANYFESLTYYRERMSEVDDDWEAPIPPMPPRVRDQLINWCRHLIPNKAVPAFKPAFENPDLVLYVDASEHGWGCVSIKGGVVKTFNGRWSEADRAAHKVQSSVSSEPLGALRAARAVVTKAMTKVLIYSDHTGMVYAGNRGYGKARSYNDLIKALQRDYPNTEFHFEYVPGSMNPADKPSREIAEEVMSNNTQVEHNNNTNVPTTLLQPF